MNIKHQDKSLVGLRSEFERYGIGWCLRERGRPFGPCFMSTLGGR